MAGAANILFAGGGDVGSIPAIQALGATAAADGRQASLDINAAIIAVLGGSVTFFDEVHPTTQLQQVLGSELVMAVPEPGTALLLMLGLAGLGIRSRAA